MPMDNSNASALAAQSSAAAAAASAITASQQAGVGAAANRIYATTAAGIAATTNGQYFFVPSTATYGGFDAWQNSSGVASPVIGANGKQITTANASGLALNIVPTQFGLDSIWVDAYGFVGRMLYANGYQSGAGFAVDPVNSKLTVGGVTLNAAVIAGASVVSVVPTIDSIDTIWVDTYGFIGRMIFANGVRNEPGGTVVDPVNSALSVGNIKLSGSPNISGVVNITDGVTLGHTADPYGLAVTDRFGFVGFVTMSDGSTLIAKSAATDLQTYGARDAANVAYSNNIKMHYNTKLAWAFSGYNHIVYDGQSNSVGHDGWPGISTTPYDNNVMIGNCVGSQNASNTFTPFGASSFNPLAAVPGWVPNPGATIYTTAQVAAFAQGNQTFGETPVEGFVNNAKWLANARKQVSSDPSQIYIGSVNGISGTSITALIKTGGNWGRWTQLATIANNLAVAAGSSYQLLSFGYDQGEADGGSMNLATYQSNASGLYDSVVGDVSAISGQSRPPGMLIVSKGQYTDAVNPANCNAVPMATLTLSKQRPDEIFVIGPDYPVTDKGLHRDCNGHRWVGMYTAKVQFITQVLRRRWQPVHAMGATLNRTTVALDMMVPEPPLALDSWYYYSALSSGGTFGLRAADSLGSLTISAIRVALNTIIEFSLSRTPVGPTYVWYTGSNADGGGIRDSDTWVAKDNYVYDSSSPQNVYPVSNIPALVGKPYPLYNWCIPFNIQIQ